MDDRQVALVESRATTGLSAPLVRVEVHLGSGLPAYFLVGLPEAAVRESKERVRSALLTAGFEFPSGRITVNLAPAELPKEGGRFDLPIALGVLVASGQLPPGVLAGREFYGELALGGQLRETRKLLPALVAGLRAGAELVLPAANAREAALVAGPRVKLGRHLLEVCRALRGGKPLATAARTTGPDAAVPTPDLADVRGQATAKRALEIAATGEHGLLLIGPPGTGKTLLAQRLPGLLPPLGEQEALEVASLQSAAGRRIGLGAQRPFRSPHHTASAAALVGGGTFRPGELSLAHRGVLFLDELPEFPRNALEALREPLETGAVLMTRAKYTCEFPARFLLVAAMNPCPCGYAGDPRGRCRCTGSEVARYRNRLSGPLIDRIDMHVPMRAVPLDELMRDQKEEPPERTCVVAQRVMAARDRQLARQGRLNALLSGAELARHCRLDRRSRVALATAVSGLGFSARGVHRVLKVARSIADLAEEADIRLSDLTEALSLRTLDRPTC
jgi:magnesium chelatase family protein